MEAEKLLEEWQNRLFLQAWRIKIYTNCKPDEMTLPDMAGCTEWDESGNTARIEIVDPKCVGDRIVPFDFEQTLVHELLHLKFCLLSSESNDLQSRYVHQLIDEMARALVDAKREKQWIPCMKDLPFAEAGESEKVLVTCRFKDAIEGYRQVDTLYYNGGTWCYPTGEVFEGTVTAWMPRPKPYEES